MTNACVAIVDPYSSGALLARELGARNVPCLAVESSPRLAPHLKSGFDATDFLDVVLHRDDPAETLRAVRRHRPTHVVAGFESGVELADWLAAELGLPANDPRHRVARRDKFLMTQLAREHGLPTARQFRSPDVEQLLRWIDEAVGWPVIVKPLDSVASDGVARCCDAQQVRQAAAAILSGPNILGLANEAVLAQEFLEGVEYAVDIVSLAGRRKVTAFWEYHRPRDRAEFVCYDAMTLLPYGGDRQEALRASALSALDALGVQHGPAHCELMWVAGRPVFIEVGARLSAGVNAVLSRVCGGVCQLDETIEAMLEPRRFLERLEDPPRLTKRATNVFLMPRRQGRLVQTRGLDRIEKLSTLYSMSVATQAGEVLGRVAGRVTLVHEDPEAIQRDVAAIRSLERDGIFDVEPVAGSNGSEGSTDPLPSGGQSTGTGR